MKYFVIECEGRYADELSEGCGWVDFVDARVTSETELFDLGLDQQWLDEECPGEVLVEVFVSLGAKK